MKTSAEPRLWTRRAALVGLVRLGAMVAAGRLAAESVAPDALLTRRIPSSGEEIPIVGLGSWRTFNVGNDPWARGECTEVMRRFFVRGGRMIDSSPMYGSSQAVIGEALGRLGRRGDVFVAEKVWTSGPHGPEQIEETRRHWGVERFDLLQVHNLEDWEAHLPRLFEMKAAGRLRYVGITTSHGRRTEDVEAIMRAHPLDFVQATYNAVDRELERRLLPLARDRGIAVIVNRPYRGGPLIDAVKRRPLPAWAAEAGCADWAQFLLKFVVSHPAVTCAIPATSVPDHVVENMGAARGPLPDEAMRRRMAEHVRGL
jgi:diketogulonate reductase-like aldo/keto reductase